ncbi:MAG: hypothetical protein KGJ43_05195 [Acidobacteriota bacterium]|nr:hypothetical protein [Acidobacteriota bacterium]
MAKITVTTDPTPDRTASVLLDESVSPLHLGRDEHAAQLVERIGWAIADSEDA